MAMGEGGECRRAGGCPRHQQPLVQGWVFNAYNCRDHSGRTIGKTVATSVEPCATLRGAAAWAAALGRRRQPSCDTPSGRRRHVVEDGHLISAIDLRLQRVPGRVGPCPLLSHASVFIAVN